MRKGQTTMLGIMLFVMVLITTIVFIEPIKDQVAIARGAALGLDCAASGNSVGIEMSCIVIDWTLTIFIMACLSVGVTLIGLRGVRQGGG